MVKQKIYETIVDNLPIGFTVVDENGITIDFNRAAETITGFAKEDVIGKHHNEIFHRQPVKEECPLFKYALSQKKPLTAREKHFVKNTGELITLLVSVSPMFDSDGKFIGGIEIFRDMSDIRKLQREMKNILAMFAHDMENSIATSIGFTSRLLSGKQDNYIEYLNIILHELKTVEVLIMDFLEFSKIEAREYKPECEDTDIYNLLLKQVEVASLNANEKNIAVVLNPTETEIKTVKADKVMINRVISNLLDNAVKYTNPGGKITITLSDKEGDILIQVQDTGIGISPEHMPYIFDPFYRIKRDHKGSGLGLSIATEIVESHGGRIWAESVLGKGSTFSFTIPK
jgi:PAS domain S-box-containing protein